jgi:hypothetical protein
MTAPDSIIQLVQRFDRNRDSYRSGKYNEAQLRQEFLNPFFEALGWDVFNNQGYAEAYKEVIHEASLEVEGATKAPDYAFRIGGTRKFFVEAKKPAVNIEYDIYPAFQLRRYAWSAKLPLSILTDFEEFAVYESRTKPDKSDSAATGRVMLLNYKDYPSRWDELAAIFSPEAIKKGSFDQYAESHTGKRGTIEVDDAFLAEIEGWRDLLAHNIARHNPDLQVRELNYAVQMTIDRIVFLRICEDRGIERDGQLQDLLEGEGVYARLCQLFRQADSRYNSGLFHFSEEKERFTPQDDLTLRLAIDDKVLKEIIRGLYYPAPYVFREIPADILGQVYERFLGKVIRLTAGHQAKVEEKPEVRKAGGVYYTPTYIVDYIVKNTVGKLLEGKTPKEAASLKILDPACGSGSFLLGAYQVLLDWHTKYYSEHDPETWAKAKTPVIYQAQGGGWKLTTAEKKRILLVNIHGVDIDPQAVEVTKLSLSLKVLEGESQETIGAQLGLFKERALPDLGRNIQCGNSLIGPDYYEDRQLTMSFIDDEERYRVNAFDWQAAFPQVFDPHPPAAASPKSDWGSSDLGEVGRGFDAVIGNPPYIRILNLVDYYPGEVRFIQSHYSTAGFGKVDIYVAFVEKGMQVINKNGLLGFILPNKFMQADYGIGLRTLLCEKQAITQLIDFGNAQVFEGATTYTCLLFLSNSTQTEFRAKFNKSYLSPEQYLEEVPFEKRNAQSFSSSPWQMASSRDAAILDKLGNYPTRLSNMVELAITGVKTGANSIFVFEVIQFGNEIAKLRPEDTDKEVELETKYLVPYLKAESLKRYHIGSGSRVLLFPYKSINGQTRLVPEAELKNYSKTWQYLNEFKHELEGRQKGKLKGPSWYGLSFSSSLQMFSVQKIITPTLSPQNSFALDVNGNFFPQGAGGGCGFVPKRNISANYLLGLLNSHLLTFYFQRISSPFQGGWYAYEPRYLERIPIRTINFSDPAEKAAHDRLVSLVERMLSLHKQSPRTPQEKEIVQRDIESTDQAIDTLVYQLYGLTPAEINIVEGR